MTIFRGASAADLRAAIAARDTAWEGRPTSWREQLGMFGRSSARTPRPSATSCWGWRVATAPGATWAIRAAAQRPVRFDPRAAGLGGGRAGVKIGLVTPYIYPLPGGVNAHVGYLYENLVARGHDVRIISSTHGPQSSSEGDIIRLGYGWSVPTNGSVGTLTVSHRYGQLVSEMLDRERFDVLHFHEPFVPFLSLQLLRYSTSVNVATFHAYSGLSPSYEFGKRMLQRFARRLHGRIAVSAAARHFISRYFPGDYKVIPNGVDLGHFDGVPPFARWRDGIPNILFVGRFENRKGAHVPAPGLPPAAPRGPRLPAAGRGPRAAGERGPALHRHAAARRRGAAGPGQRPRQGTRLRHGGRLRLARRRARSRSASCCWRRWPPGVPIVCSDIHGYKGVVRRGEQALLVPPRDVEGLAAALGTLLRDPLLRARMGESGRPARGAVRLGEHHGQGRGLLRLRHPPPGRSGSLPPGFRVIDPRAAGARPAQAPRLWSSQVVGPGRVGLEPAEGGGRRRRDGRTRPSAGHGRDG